MLPLGSRHHSLDLSETKDVTEIIRAFQEHTNSRLVLALSVIDIGRAPCLFVTVVAYEPGLETPDQVPLASANVCSLNTNLRFLKDVVTHVLYLLDGQLARNEMRGTQ